MSVGAAEIARVLSEISEVLSGAFLNKIVRSGPDEWIFVFRAGVEKFPLLLSLSSANGRIHLASDIPEGAVEPGHFTGLLKKHIVGARLDSITQINGDRVVMMTFDTRDGRRSAVAEIMGSRGNMYVMDENGSVMAVALDRKSRLASGDIYTPPPASEKNLAEVAPVKSGALIRDFPFNRLIEKRFDSLAKAEKLAKIKMEALSPLRAELKKIAKRRRELALERDELGRYALHKRLGDILGANFALVKKGEASVRLPDVYSPEGAFVEIALDPSKAVAENIQRYYKLYRKYEKGLPRIDGESAALNTREKRIEEEISAIEKIGDIGDAVKITPPPSMAKKRETAKEREKSGPRFARRFISSDGMEMLVGRTDRENEEITFKVANGRDLWLHARDYPGSHVVARLPKNTEPPQATLREAAMLAIHYSKAAKSGKGEVTYSRVKDVTKPKGAPPGKVLVRGAKVLQVKVDPEKIREMKERAERG